MASASPVREIPAESEHAPAPSAATLPRTKFQVINGPQNFSKKFQAAYFGKPGYSVWLNVHLQCGFLWTVTAEGQVIAGG